MEKRDIPVGYVIAGIFITIAIIIAISGYFLFTLNKYAEISGGDREGGLSGPAPSKVRDAISEITDSAGERNYRLATEIVKNYHDTHTVYGEDVYSCGDMASDVWDQLESEGINAKIEIGRVDREQPAVLRCNHAWVIAEIEPDRWLAFETTGGYPVIDNASYYQGYSFSTPRSYRDFEQLIGQYNSQLSKLNSTTDRYNDIVSEYNNGNFFTKIWMQKDLETAADILAERQNDLDETYREMFSLVKNQDGSVP